MTIIPEIRRTESLERTAVSAQNAIRSAVPADHAQEFQTAADRLRDSLNDWEARRADLASNREELSGTAQVLLNRVREQIERLAGLLPSSAASNLESFAEPMLGVMKRLATDIEIATTHAPELVAGAWRLESQSIGARRNLETPDNKLGTRARRWSPVVIRCLIA